MISCIVLHKIAATFLKEVTIKTLFTLGTIGLQWTTYKIKGAGNKIVWFAMTTLEYAFIAKAAVILTCIAYTFARWYLVIRFKGWSLFC